MDGVKVQAICEDCKERFEVSNGNLKSVEAHIKSGSATLLYYSCPSCGRCHFVQADDDTTRFKLEQCTKMVAKLAIARKTNSVKKKDLKQFKALRKELDLMRNNLMAIFTGCEVTVDGRALKVRFSK